LFDVITNTDMTTDRSDQMEDQTRSTILEHLAPLEGQWDVEATHPLLPGTVIRGTALFEWLDGEQFLIWRSHYEHPDIPNAIAILGGGEPGSGGPSSDSEGGFLMHYFDSRGISRVYKLDADSQRWQFWRETPGFSQRYIYTISGDRNTMSASGELSRDGTTWDTDLQATYRRVARG